MSLMKSLIAGVAIAAAFVSAPVVAANRHVAIVNNTSHAIREFYASNIGTDSWQEDILGAHVIPPYSVVDVNIDDGTGYCMFDLKAVMDTGEEVVRGRVNVCSVSSWTISE